ncbi:uncharacterized protein LOC125501375 [Athalia rosae]|uniref:uncharacterized protein LOC125501375 n=1 Tax=Athalia rosae TaxID=37344 RepID=UPI00203481FC|nr:uncharacterized protein LOC125501375 [Athalia rosae]
MGGKSAKPKIPSYAPYQCCPAEVARGTKVAKASPVAKSVGRKSSTKLQVAPPLKPINKLSAKDSKKTANLQVPSTTAKADSKSGKGKKGFFGSVVAGIPYLIKV